MVVDVYTGASLNAGKLKIVYVDRENKTFTYQETGSTTATLKTGDKVYVQGSKD